MWKLLLMNVYRKNIYIKQPKGFPVNEQENLVCKLKKACMAWNKLSNNNISTILYAATS